MGAGLKAGTLGAGLGLKLGQESRSTGASLESRSTEASLKMGVVQESGAIVVILALGPARSLGSQIGKQGQQEPSRVMRGSWCWDVPGAWTDRNPPLV